MIALQTEGPGESPLLEGEDKERGVATSPAGKAHPGGGEAEGREEHGTICGGEAGLQDTVSELEGTPKTLPPKTVTQVRTLEPRAISRLGQQHQKVTKLCQNAGFSICS